MTDSAKQTFWQAMAASPNIMIKLIQSDLHSEPMHAILDKEAQSQFWLYTTKDNRIASGGKAMAQFISKGHDVFACIAGKLVEETDPVIIEKYWNKEVEAWYPDGKVDSRLKMLRFELIDAEIWLVNETAVAKTKLSIGSDVNLKEFGGHYKVRL